jgi:RES domain.
MSPIQQLQIKKYLIKQLETKISCNATQNEYKSIINKLIDNVPVTAIFIENDPIYRARKHEIGKLFTHRNDLIYPKAEFVKTKGRFNDIHESVFYASTSELGSIIELAPDINTCFVISSFKKNTLDHKNYAYKLGFKADVPPNEFTPKYNKIVIDYLNEKTTKPIQDQSEYDLTISLGDFYLKKKIINADEKSSTLIVYPSANSKIPCNQSTYNLVMQPHVFEKMYKFIEVYLYLLTFETTHYQLNPVNHGKLDCNDKIQWTFDHETMVSRVKKGLWYNDHESESIKSLSHML